MFEVPVNVWTLEVICQLWIINELLRFRFRFYFGYFGSEFEFEFYVGCGNLQWPVLLLTDTVNGYCQRISIKNMALAWKRISVKVITNSRRATIILIEAPATWWRSPDFPQISLPSRLFVPAPCTWDLDQFVGVSLRFLTMIYMIRKSMRKKVLEFILSFLDRRSMRSSPYNVNGES